MRARTLACLMWMLAPAASLGAAPASAAPAKVAPAAASQPRLLKQLEVTTDRNFRLLNPDRYVQVRDEHETGAEPGFTLDALQLTILDLTRLETAKVRVGLQALYGERAAMFIDGQATWQNKSGQAYPTFQASLLAYDPERKRCGVLLDNSASDGVDGSWRSRFLYLAWDPAKDSLGQEVLLREDAGTKAERYLKFFVELGPDPSGRYQYFLSMQALPSEERPDRAAGRLELSRLDLDSLQVDWRYTFDTPVSNNKNVYSSYRWAFSPDGSHLVLAEYSEADLEPIEPPPSLYLVNIAGKSHLSMPVRHTPYGLVVDATNRTLVVASSQDRKLTLYDLEKRAREREVDGPSRVHQAALSRDGKQLILFPRGRALELRDLTSLKLKVSLQISKLLPGTPALDGERTCVSLDRRFAVVPPADEYGFGDEKGLYVLELP
jgi:hypothetical protein